MIYKTIGAWTEQVKKAHTTARYRAMNKAMAKANTQLKRGLSKDLGIKSKDASKRLRIKKASMKSLSAFISIGVKYGLPLHIFKPRVKLVRKGKRKYNGVTVAIPFEGGRKLSAGGFMVTAKSGIDLVMTRLGAARVPIKTMTYKLDPVAILQRDKQQPSLREDYKAQFKQQLKLQMQKVSG